MDAHQARAALRQLVDEGWLVGVEVFGGCDHDGCEAAGQECWSYGLCDVFSKHAVGSDCNRAEKHLLRPSDTLMDAELAALIVDESQPFTPAP